MSSPTNELNSKIDHKADDFVVMHYTGDLAMDVRTPGDVEQIIRSVIQQYGLFDVRTFTVQSVADGWEIRLTRGDEGQEPHRFRVLHAPAARVREHIANHLGVRL